MNDTTPIAFFIFNRPDLTKIIFRTISNARPSRLLVIADGPRKNIPEDLENCEASREVITHVDWKCEVLTNYSEVNLGLKERISSGLNWVFDNCDEAIILEDDCLPNQSFFKYCEQLLEFYRNEDQIMMVSGDNFQFGTKRGNYSYYFSRYFHIWGWATWKRAWQYYDVSMNKWPTLRDTSWLYELFKNKIIVNYWKIIFDDVYNGKINSWAYQWFFSGLVLKGLAVMPNVNLVSNLGFDTRATHTKNSKQLLANIKTEKMIFPLQHPKELTQNYEADIYSHYKLNENRIMRRIYKRLIGKFQLIMKTKIFRKIRPK